MRILLVNGIWTHGESNVDRIGTKLRTRGLDVVDIQLPEVGPWGARFKGPAHGEIVLKHSQPGDVIVAHSFGCLRAAHAMRTANIYSHAYFFRPAMSRNWSFGPNTSVTCIYSPDDNAIRAGSLLLWHPFGRAGISGFTSPQARNLASVGHHNADFSPPLIDIWTNRICDELRHSF